MSTEIKAASVEFQAVTKAYGSVIAVNNISFRIEPGTLVTLLGPSGCGKTTNLRMIAGLEQVTSGEIYIGERNVTQLPVTQRDVSMVFQSYALFPHMSVLENVCYGLKEQGLKKAAAIKAAEEGMEMVGLVGYGKRMPNELSGGQQQRVAVARALVLKPKVLLFDEPLSNLDAKLRRRVREEIRELQQNLGLTAVYVTHDQEEAMAVSDKIIVMKNAEIAQHASPRELYEEPGDLFIADFIGDATMVKGTFIQKNGENAVFDLAGVKMTLPHRNIKGLHGDMDIAIRPHALHVSTEIKENCIQGKVGKSTYLGGFVEYEIDTPLGNLFAVDHQAVVPIPVGEKVSVEIGQKGVALVG